MTYPRLIEPVDHPPEPIAGPALVGPAEFLTALGGRIRILRRGRGLTQTQLANAAGVSRSFLSLLEHGSHGVEIIRLRRIADALNIALPDLLHEPGTGPGAGGRR